MLRINNDFDTEKVQTRIFPNSFTMRLYLRKVKTAAPTDIIYSFRWKNHRVNLTKGLKVIPDQWDQERQRAIVSHRLPEIYNVVNEHTNSVLEEDSKKFEILVEEICLNPDKILIFDQIIKDIFMSHKSKPTEAKKIDIFEEIRRAVVNDSSISKNTQDNYIKKGLKAFREFSEYRKKTGCGEIDSFEMIDTDLIYEFVDFLATGQYVQADGRQYAMGTLNSIIKYAVAAIKCAPSKFLPKSKAALIQSPLLTDKTAGNNEIALSNQEVMKLWRWEPTDRKDREIRDMFLLECTTGQRVSDLSKIGAGMQEKDGLIYITIVQEKTSSKIVVPIIFQIAKEILLRYKSSLPNVGKDKINKNIKRIANAAGIEGTETISRHYNGEDKPSTTHHDRCELISTHTGRRTFVSLLALRGWNYEQIAKYTGHTNVKTVQGYDKSTAVDKEVFKTIKPEDRVLFVEEVSMGEQSKDNFAETMPEYDEDKESAAYNAVAVLTRAAKQLDYKFGRRKGWTDLLELSQFLKSKKEEIITNGGLEEYEKIREGICFGASEAEQALMNRYFAMTEIRWKGRPIRLYNFEAAIEFWKKEARKTDYKNR